MDGWTEQQNKSYTQKKNNLSSFCILLSMIVVVDIILESADSQSATNCEEQGICV